jgi:peroxiredoxin
MSTSDARSDAYGPGALPAGLPIPVDDGAAAHLEGMRLPALPLTSVAGRVVDMAEEAFGTLVVYAYAQTGVPGRPVPEGWDAVPGARGCTPQSCAFRDWAPALAELGVRVYGVSAQDPAEQRDFVARHGLPFELLHDGGFVLAERIGLPTFELGGRRYYRRLTLIARAGRIVKVFYPVFPPQDNAAHVLDWLRDHRAVSG